MHDVYDGVWACASLLHCARNRLPDVLKRIHAALRRGGVCYISFNDPSQNNGQHVPLKINVTLIFGDSRNGYLAKQCFSSP